MVAQRPFALFDPFVPGTPQVWSIIGRYCNRILLPLFWSHLQLASPPHAPTKIHPFMFKVGENRCPTCGEQFPRPWWMLLTFVLAPHCQQWVTEFCYPPDLIVTDGTSATGSDPVVELQKRLARSRAANGRANAAAARRSDTRGAKSTPRARGQQGSSLERESRREQSTLARLASLAQYGPRRALSTIRRPKVAYVLYWLNIQ